MGMIMRPDKVLPFLNLDRGFGIKAEDFIMAGGQPGQGGAQPPGAPTDEMTGSGQPVGPVDNQGTESATRLAIAA